MPEICEVLNPFYEIENKDISLLACPQSSNLPFTFYPHYYIQFKMWIYYYRHVSEDLHYLPLLLKME